jgi:hypothetical protein
MHTFNPATVKQFLQDIYKDQEIFNSSPFIRLKERLKNPTLLDNCRFTYPHLRKFLILALQNSNRESETEPYLLEIQENANRKRIELISKIKEEIADRAQSLQKRDQKQIETAPQNAQTTRPLTQGSSSSSMPETTYPDLTTSGSRYDKPEVKPSKIKTRKPGRPPEEPVQEAIAHPQDQLMTIETLLKNNKQALSIFNKLFANYETQNVRVSAIDISFNEIEQLMGALEQDFSKDKGKGSHTKVTLSRDRLQPDFDDDDMPPESMIILSKKTKLSGAQIADIRDRFIEYYLFPAHLKDTLIRSRKLPF